MLTPNKHLNLDASVLRVFSLIVREMQKRGVWELEKLRSFVIRRVGPDGEFAFLSALDLLYLFGRLEYHIKNDTIEYRVEQNAA